MTVTDCDLGAREAVGLIGGGVRTLLATKIGAAAGILTGLFFLRRATRTRS